MRSTTVSSGWITTQAVISDGPPSARTPATLRSGLTPIASPPPTTALEMMNGRREIWGDQSAGLRLGGHVNGLAHLLEGAAAANIGDRGIDFGVGRPRFPAEERGDGHDHARLAIAALRDVLGDPRLLHLMQDTAL